MFLCLLSVHVNHVAHFNLIRPNGNDDDEFIVKRNYYFAAFSECFDQGLTCRWVERVDLKSRLLAVHGRTVYRTVTS